MIHTLHWKATMTEVMDKVENQTADSGEAVRQWLFNVPEQEHSQVSFKRSF